jgi:hypothetical protein
MPFPLTQRSRGRIVTERVDHRTYGGLMETSGIAAEKGNQMNGKAVKPRFITLLIALLGMFLAATPAWASSAGTAQVSSHEQTAHVSTFTGGGPVTVTNVSGDIQENSCTSGRATWVHMTMNGVTRCFGGTGTLGFSGNVTYWFCSGNNYGTVKYWKGGNPYSLGFTNLYIQHCRMLPRSRPCPYGFLLAVC